jgi:hypothetical protein
MLKLESYRQILSMVGLLVSFDDAAVTEQLMKKSEGRGCLLVR